MIHRLCNGILIGAALCGLTLFAPPPAAAALMADPVKLYAEMRAAYDKGNREGWTFYNQEYYLSTLFNAGRAYSLQLPNDPTYGVIAQQVVDIATGVHYDPLINHDAVPWYVNEAALYVQKNNPNPAEQAKARDLLARVKALEDPNALAQFADEDAAANVQLYPHDTNALLQRVEADWRGWLLTHDSSWRGLALQRANEPDFPIADLPSTWGPGFVDALKNAAAGAEGYTQGDGVNAQAVLARLKKVNPLMIIANVKAITHQAMMTTLAPADEYFGPMGMSILGIRNELNRVNYMIGYGYARQESGEAVQIAVSVDDLHKVYPRDRDLPQLLLDVYQTLGKIGTPDASAAAAHMRAILTVEYQDTPQARSLLS